MQCSDFIIYVLSGRALRLNETIEDVSNNRNVGANVSVAVYVVLIRVGISRVGIIRVGIIRVGISRVGIVRVGIIRVGIIRVGISRVVIVRVGIIQGGDCPGGKHQGENCPDTVIICHQFRRTQLWPLIMIRSLCHLLGRNSLLLTSLSLRTTITGIRSRKNRG